MSQFSFLKHAVLIWHGANKKANYLIIWKQMNDFKGFNYQNDFQLIPKDLISEGIILVVSVFCGCGHGQVS